MSIENRNITIVVLSILIGFFSMSFNTYGLENKQQVSIILDNEYISYNEEYGVPFIDDNHRTMVPLRLTLEFFGAEVDWDHETNQAIVTKGDVVVRVPIGEKYILKDNEKVENDTYAVVIGTEYPRTYMPIRIVMEAFGCEVLWDGDNQTVIIKSGNIIEEKELEIKYDLREEGNVTSVKDQLDIGACWAFAALGSIESNLLKQTAELYDFSEDNVSLKHGYNLTQDEGGDFMLALAYFARWSGPVLETDDIYGDGISNVELKSVKHIQEAYIIPSKDYTTIKKSIKTYGGIHTSIYWEYNDVEENKYYNKTTYAQNYNGDNVPNHDVVIVGWDDEFSKENFIIQPEKDGAFICKNSFGMEFGEEGYFYISYYDTNIGMHNIVYSSIEDNDNYDKIYQADWLGLVGKLGYNADTAYFANAYTTGDVEEQLSAISFYTTGDNSQYEIYIVEDFTSEEDFINKKFIDSGYLEYSGYYTIKLDDVITLDKNSKFSIIVKITTPGSKFPIAAEFNKDVKWLDKVDLSDGEGYISYDGKKWQSTEESLSSNVCLKAFTNIVNINNTEQPNEQDKHDAPKQQEQQVQQEQKQEQVQQEQQEQVQQEQQEKNDSKENQVDMKEEDTQLPNESDNKINYKVVAKLKKIELLALWE
jgi:C1A family cysteine protease